MYTQAHSVHKNTGGGNVPPKHLGGVWGGGTRRHRHYSSANAFTIDINSTNGNTSIKADVSKEKLNLIKNFLGFFKIF